MKTINENQFIVCDTNVMLFIYEGSNKSIGKEARSILKQSISVLPAICKLEVDYLHEIGKWEVTGDEVFSQLIYDTRAIVDLTSLVTLTKKAEKISWTRDPFDRLIVATSEALNAPLITADRLILKHHPNAIPLGE